MAAVFKGFSSPTTGNTQVLTDVNLVKKDLINHFYTRKGEKPMNQEYGFIGHDLIFELDLPGTQSKLETDARRIIETDPRVTEVSIDVQVVSYGYNVVIELYFNVLDLVDTLYLTFDQSRSDEQL